MPITPYNSSIAYPYSAPASSQPVTPPAVSSNPSGTGANLKTPAAQTYVQSKITPPVDNTSKVNDINSKITDLNSQVTTLKNAGLDDTSDITKGANGSYSLNNKGKYDQNVNDYKTAYQGYIKGLTSSDAVNKAQTAYNDFTASESKGITSLEGKDAAVPLSIVRGQQAKMKALYDPEATRLQNNINIAQNDQANQNNAGLANVSLQEKLLGMQPGSPANIKAEKEANKLDTAVVDTDKGQLLVDKQTGKVLNNLGVKSSTASSVASLVTPELLKSINDGKIDPNKLNSRTVGIYNDIAKAGVDAVNAAATSEGQINAVKDLTTYKSTAQRTLNTIDANLPLVANLADTVNGTGMPIFDSVINGTKALTTNDPNIVKYVNSLKTLRSEYAQMLAKGGTATEGDKAEAAKAIPDGLSGDAYRALGEQLSLEANNIIGASDDAIKSANSKSNSNSANSGGTGTTTSGLKYTITP